METVSKNLRCISIVGAITTLAVFILVLIIRAFFLTQFDIFDNRTIDGRVCFVPILPLGLGFVWLFYRGAFMGETYTEDEQSVLTFQARILAATVCAVFVTLLIAFWALHEIFKFALLSLGLLLICFGVSTLKGHVSLITFQGMSNRGPAASIIGILTLSLAALILLFGISQFR